MGKDQVEGLKIADAFSDLRLGRVKFPFAIDLSGGADLRIIGQHVPKSAVPLDRRRRAAQPPYLHKGAFSTQQLSNVFACQPPYFIVVATDVGAVHAGTRLPVDNDDGNAILKSLFHHGGNGLSLIRRYDEQVDLALDKVCYVLDLLFAAVLSIPVDQFHFRVEGQLSLHGHKHLPAPRVAACTLRKTNTILNCILDPIAIRARQRHQCQEAYSEQTSAKCSLSHRLALLSPRSLQSMMNSLKKCKGSVGWFSNLPVGDRREKVYRRTALVRPLKFTSALNPGLFIVVLSGRPDAPYYESTHPLPVPARELAGAQPVAQAKSGAKQQSVLFEHGHHAPEGVQRRLEKDSAAGPLPRRP